MSKTSSVIPRLAAANSNSHMKYLLGILGLSTGAMAIGLNSCAKQEQTYLDNAKSKLNSQEEPKNIYGFEALQYPWYIYYK